MISYSISKQGNLGETCGIIGIVVGPVSIEGYPS